jgi:hypothetical protein
MPRPCRSPAMPCRLGFRICLSLLIYTVRPCLIHPCHAASMPCSDHAVLLKATAQHVRRETAMLCRGLEKNRMVRAWHGRGMASVNQTRPHCVNQKGKTHSKPLVAQHGRGTAWARHGHGMVCVNRPVYQYPLNWRQCGWHVSLKVVNNYIVSHFILLFQVLSSSV